MALVKEANSKWTKVGTSMKCLGWGKLNKGGSIRRGKVVKSFEDCNRKFKFDAVASTGLR